MSYKTKIIFAALGILAVAAVWHAFFRSAPADGGRSVTVTINGLSLRTEAVSDEQERRVGLGGRDDLCLSCAMLFRFPAPGRYNFWMKDMRFALDIIWILDEKIVHIEKNVPNDFSGILDPRADADQVLETNAGIADSMGFKTGDSVTVR